MLAGPLAREQAVGHRVLRRNPLDHERARVDSQPLEELRDRHVPADRDVVDQRQAKRQVRAAALGQVLALAAAPAESGRRVDVPRDRS